jgi:alkylated DNA repair dioxygenase AlkB
MQGVEYRKQYLSGVTLELIQTQEMVEYLFRGKKMRRAPKREFWYPGHADLTYRWGQQKICYPGGSAYTGLQMPEWMLAAADGIRSEFNEHVNHAILIKYESGMKNWAPPHKDKVTSDTSFFVLSFGTPRRFEMLETILVSSGTKTKMKNAPGEVIWGEHLENGSLLVVSGPANERYYHAVPKDKTWTGSPRYSLIFRTIKD